MHRVHHAGATVSAHKAQVSLPEVLIVGQRCNAKRREPDPSFTNPTKVRCFLGWCGKVRIWIPNYSQIVQTLTKLYHKNRSHRLLPYITRDHPFMIEH